MIQDKKNIIISGVNLTNVGPFSVLEDCLGYLSEDLSAYYNIIALVNDKSVFKLNNIKYYEFPRSKKSWINRAYYEYVYFKKLSREIKPYLWFSLHDMTPNVESELQAVYCHNPSPFYKLSLRDYFTDPKFTSLIITTTMNLKITQTQKLIHQIPLRMKIQTLTKIQMQTLIITITMAMNLNLITTMTQIVANSI